MPTSWRVAAHARRSRPLQRGLYPRPRPRRRPPEDVQDQGQRHRPHRDHRALRHRRRPLHPGQHGLARHRHRLQRSPHRGQPRLRQQNLERRPLPLHEPRPRPRGRHRSHPPHAECRQIRLRFDRGHSWVGSTTPTPLESRWILSRLNAVSAEVDRALADYRFDEAANAIYQFFWGDLCDWYLEIVKLRLNFGEVSISTDDTAATAAHLPRWSQSSKSALRLLSPFMPFLTEEIWHALYAGLPPAKSIALTRYPQAATSLRRSSHRRDADFAGAHHHRPRPAQGTWRSREGVRAHQHPRRRASLDPLEFSQDMLARLARVSAIEISADALTGNNARSTSSFDVAVLYERQIDVPAERERLTKDLAKYRKRSCRRRTSALQRVLHGQSPRAHRRRPAQASRRDPHPLRQDQSRPRRPAFTLKATPGILDRHGISRSAFVRPLPGNARSTSSFEVAVLYERQIDVPAERERLTKDLAKYEKGLAAAERQLSNESFMAKAPAHIVEGLRKQAAETRTLYDKTKAALDALPSDRLTDPSVKSKPSWTGNPAASPPCSKPPSSRTRPPTTSPPRSPSTPACAPPPPSSPSRVASSPASAASPPSSASTASSHQSSRPLRGRLAPGDLRRRPRQKGPGHRRHPRQRRQHPLHRARHPQPDAAHERHRHADQ